MGLATIATVIVGDERNPPKRHGLRAPAHRWLQLILSLTAEDPALRDSLREHLAAPSSATLPVAGCSPVIKPGTGRLL